MLHLLQLPLQAARVGHERHGLPPVVGTEGLLELDEGDVVVEVVGVVADVDDDLVRLDDPLVGVLHPGVVVPHRHPQLLDLDVHHAVRRRDDVDVRDGGAAAEVEISEINK